MIRDLRYTHGGLIAEQPIRWRYRKLYHPRLTTMTLIGSRRFVLWPLWSRIHGNPVKRVAGIVLFRRLLGVQWYPVYAAIKETA
jgi:hypothetical protein